MSVSKTPASRALSLVERGFSVIPLYGRMLDGSCTCKLGKKCPHPAAHPIIRREEQYLVTSNPEKAKEWWNARKSSEIGIACGQNVVAILCDGEDQVTQLSQRGDLGTPLTVRGSYRRAFLFRCSSPLPSRRCIAAVLGADFFGEGGWILELEDETIRADSLPELPDSFERLICPNVSEGSSIGFPIDIFPTSIQEFIKQGAAAIPCAPEMVGANVIAAAAGLIGGGRSLELKPGYVAFSSLFCAIVAPPGTGKTPTANLALAPVRRLQSAMMRDYEQKIDEYKRMRKIYDLNVEIWRDQYRKFKSGCGEDPGQEPDKPQKPVQTQLFTTDSTPEANLQLLEENNGSLLFAHDELKPWFWGSNRSLWLSLWSSETAMVNRKTENDRLYIERPVISVVGNLTLNALRKLGSELEESDGFVDRILFCLPRDVSETQVSTASISEEVLNRYNAIFEKLLRMREEDHGHRLLKLAPEAMEPFFKWAESHREESRHQSVSPILRGIYAKLVSYAGRFALILHCLREAAGEIHSAEVDVCTVQCAIQLVRYFKNQAKILLDRLGSQKSDERIEDVLSWMQRRGAIFRLRECQRSGVAGVKSAADARAVFTQLEARGYGTVTSGKRGSVLFALRKEYVVFDTEELAKLHQPSDLLEWLSNNC